MFPDRHLGSLGWDILRVWSTDGFDNPARETEKLTKKLEELRYEDVQRRMAEQFGLGRLREVTRVRFAEALKVARDHLSLAQA